MMITLKTLLLTGAAFLTFTQISSAQTPNASTSEQPLEISAKNALEWDRVNKKYIARGNALAKQNDFQVDADLLVAEYRDGGKDGGSTDIYRLTATGNVVLTSGGVNKAYGDKAVYEVDAGKATMTGGNLHIDTPEMKITAQEKFEYYSNEGKMVAYGSPVIDNQGNKLTADVVTAWTAPKDDKKEEEKKSSSAPATSSQKMAGNLKRAEAEGNVVITTPKEKATSDKAIYTGDNDTVELMKNVKLYQGPNTLEGTRAEMNLTTGVSKMFGSEGKDGRVKGVFFPSSKKDKPATSAQ